MSADTVEARSKAERAPHQATLYLDHSTWNYLIKGRGPDGADYGPILARLLALSTAGVIRVRISMANAAEVALMVPQQRARWIEIVGGLEGAVLAGTFWDSICAAELDRPGTPPDIGDVPVRFDLVGLAEQVNAMAGSPRAALHRMQEIVRISLRARGFSRWVARWEKAAGRMNRKKEERRLQARRWTRAMLAGDPELTLTRSERRRGVRIPFRARALVRFGTFLRKRLLSPEQDATLRRAYTLEDRGLDWVLGLGLPRVTCAASLSEGWEKKEGKLRPACALRTAHAKSKLDPLHNVEPADEWDGYHLCYVAHSDWATVDGPTLGATDHVLRHLAAPRAYAGVDLSRLLDDFELLSRREGKSQET